ncbi:hypothetical protein H4R34_000622 [Dimargaris verticillata]|uniref:RRM Nup35-type domain-containing protein n=1 Tax=Dimargaris verticillata TaxID=2761393 RepID=A0A9W8EFR1_9FUNG|nr:hypothetical protein H4R34_000622 [Dimargaris verticillata]
MQQQPPPSFPKFANCASPQRYDGLAMATSPRSPQAMDITPTRSTVAPQSHHAFTSPAYSASRPVPAAAAMDHDWVNRLSDQMKQPPGLVADFDRSQVIGGDHLVPGTSTPQGTAAGGESAEQEPAPQYLPSFLLDSLQPQPSLPARYRPNWSRQHLPEDSGDRSQGILGGRDGSASPTFEHQASPYLKRRLSAGSGFGHHDMLTHRNKKTAVPMDIITVTGDIPPAATLDDIATQQQALDDQAHSSGHPAGHTNGTQAGAPSAQLPGSAQGALSNDALEKAGYKVTVFGFPAQAASEVFDYFQQFGMVSTYSLAPAGGNYLNLVYVYPADAKKALACNGQIIGNNIMVGVVNASNKPLAGLSSGATSSTSPGLMGISPAKRSLGAGGFFRALTDSVLTKAHGTNMATGNTGSSPPPPPFSPPQLQQPMAQGQPGVLGSQQPNTAATAFTSPVAAQIPPTQSLGQLDQATFPGRPWQPTYVPSNTNPSTFNNASNDLPPSASLSIAGGGGGEAVPSQSLFSPSGAPQPTGPYAQALAPASASPYGQRFAGSTANHHINHSMAPLSFTGSPAVSQMATPPTGNEPFAPSVALNSGPATPLRHMTGPTAASPLAQPSPLGTRRAGPAPPTSRTRRAPIAPTGSAESGRNTPPVTATVQSLKPIKADTDNKTAKGNGNGVWQNAMDALFGW